MSWFKKEIEKTEELVLNYKNLFFLFLSLIFAYLILKSEFLNDFILNLGNLGYIGVFISGLFFSYGFTAVPSISILYLLSKNLNPILVALIGMIGAVISDYLIFQFVKYRLIDEIKKIKNKFRFHPHFKKSYIKILKIIAPLISGLILASPLPDEVAISILGSIKYNDVKFIIVSSLSKFLGILIITLI